MDCTDGIGSLVLAIRKAYKRFFLVIGCSFDQSKSVKFERIDQNSMESGC